MNHLPHLITDLGLILAAAAIVTLVFKLLKQPLVLGYIIAGMLVGPHFFMFPTIGDSESVEVWAQIGVIFLLFSLGLEFSFKKLVKVGGSAALTACLEVGIMMLLGYMIGQALGWDSVSSLFLGSMIAISSTTIIIRTFDELGVKSKNFAHLVFGILVIQDLVAIVLLVLLPSLAVKKGVTGMSLAFPVVKLVFFLVLWFVSGIFFLPTLLRKAGKIMNDEMLLVTSLALCFAMVILATSVGFSPALGAFVMGSILAETRLGGKIEHLTKSIKELFGAVFFISVGMMIEPAVLPLYWRPILFITLAVIIGQPLATIIGALLSGNPLRRSIQVGLSLSQIGEFSFIIAALGLSLHAINGQLYPIIVAVSAITTFTTPYMVKVSLPAHRLVERLLPERLKQMISSYSSGSTAIKMVSDWRILVRVYLLQTAIYCTIILALLIAMRQVVVPLWVQNDNNIIKVSATVIVLLVVCPFLWALTLRNLKQEVTLRLWKERRYKGPLLMLQSLRIFIALLLTFFLLRPVAHYPLAWAAVVIVALLIIPNYNRLSNIYNGIEDRFIINLNDKEKLEARENGHHLVPWDAHITNFTLSTDYTGVGKTLVELQLRERFGVNVAMIKRGLFVINVPDRNERLYPGDEMFLIGTDEQIEGFKKYLDLNSKIRINYRSQEQDVSLLQIEIVRGSEYIGKTIKESQFRETTKGLIVGIERGEERLLNPESSLLLEVNDILWVVGNKKRVRLLGRKGLVSRL
ncbi:MAG: cation:proton antiporter [Taibaiella sp.]|nr:cation:proton antiporter [Taibaiella sp.]